MFLKSRYILVLILLLVSLPALVWMWQELRPEGMTRKAEEALALGYAVDAEMLVKNAMDPTGVDPRPYLLHARILSRLQRHDEAEAAFRKALKLGLPEDEGRRAFALLQAARELTPAGEQNLLAALKANPDDADVLQALARGCFRSGRRAEAERFYTRVVELRPDQIDPWLERGQARLASAQEPGGRMADAIADFKEILKREPNHFEAQLALAQCHLADARLTEARAELLACRKLRLLRPEPLIGLAHCEIEEQHWAAAEQLLDQALELDPKSAQALILKGDLHLRRQLASAIELYRRALALDSRNPGVHLKLAQALQAAGKADEAKEHEQVYRKLRGAAGQP